MKTQDFTRALIKLGGDPTGLTLEEVRAAYMKLLWDKNRDSTRASMSKSVREAWADPVRRAERLRKKDITAQAAGYRSASHHQRVKQNEATALALGIDPKQFVDLPQEQQIRLKRQVKQQNVFKQVCDEAGYSYEKLTTYAYGYQLRIVRELRKKLANQ